VVGNAPSKEDAGAPAAAPDRTSLVSGAEPKPAEGEPKADAKPADPEPVKYDFKLPEGLTLDEKQLKEVQDAATEVFKDSGLPADKAQSLFEKHVAEVQKAVNAQWQAWHDMQTKWKGEVKADPEVGGTNLEANLGQINKMITEFGGKDAAAIKQALNFTGAGNEPSIVRLFHRLAQAATEGDHVAGDPNGQAGTGAQKTLASMYPSSSNAQS
jgi:hypothetical protein